MKNILIVEDDVDCAEMLKMLLEYQGHSVKCSRYGRDGIQLASSWKPDLVIIDLGLPDMCGLEFVRSLSRLESMRGCTMVVLTGRNGAGIRREAQEAGIHHFFVKGDEISNLLYTINQQT